jgi:hypothetical protein
MLRGYNEDNWSKGTTLQRGLEPRSRGVAVIRRHYQETSSEDTAGWKRLSMCASYLLSVWKLVMAL